jgi:cytochrome c oxidase assembly factor CtaG
MRWGMTPLEDQHMAGMLMWVPANLVFFSIATWLFSRWMSDVPARSYHPSASQETP